MKAFFYIFTMACVISLAFWAYRENYLTQAALADTRELRQEIRMSHERLSILRAEWAYLNRPDRLRDLAEINFDRLGLLPLHPEQFGHVDQVVYPARPEPEIYDVIDVANFAAGEARP